MTRLIAVKLKIFSPFISLLFLVLTQTVWAQNEAGRQFIKDRSNTEALLAMSEHFAQRDSARKAEAWRLAEEKGWITRKVFEDGRIIELDHINEWGHPMYLTTYNDDAAISTQTDLLHIGGGSGLDLEGNGLDIGEWDGGAVRATHEQLSGRVNQVDGATSLSSHATHVAGTLIGDGTPDTGAKGMAPQANLLAHDWDFDEQEMAARAADGLLISNHSYGFISGWHSGPSWWGDTSLSFKEDIGFGVYSFPSERWDTIAFAAPYYLIVKSAGNDRNDVPPNNGVTYFYRNDTTPFIFDSSNPKRSPEQDGGVDGYDCISWQGNAKNILTVGASKDVLNYTAPRDVVMSAFSGWGPSDDGRIKPDLVGNGVGVYSSIASADNDYASSSGTSMSAPNVAGSLLLLQEHYANTHHNTYLRASSLKALAIHTARECGPNPGPDYQFGWGLLSTKDAADVISRDVDNPSTIIEDTLTNGGSASFTFRALGSEPLTISLAYTDLPGIPDPNYTLNQRTPVLVHDLDIRLSDGSNNYFPYLLDPVNPGNAATTGDNDVDNVEQIYLANPVASQEYTLSLDHEGTLSQDQVYSLIITGQVGSYYTVPACTTGCDPSVLTNWNSARDGTGYSLAAFEQADRLVVQNGHSLSDQVSWTLTNENSVLALESGASVTIAAGHYYSIAGKIDNEGDFYVEHGASLIQSEPSFENSGSGSYHITRNTGNIIDRQRYNFWSSPLSDAYLSSVFSNSNPNDFYFFDESNQQFSSVTNPADNMVSARGYTATPDQNNSSLNFSENRTFTGSQLHNGLIELNLNWTANDYALIGNPYPSAIDNQSFLNQNPDLSGALYFFNHTNAPLPSVADYAVWNGLGATSGNGEEAPGDYIGTAQGFMVQASAAAAPALISFNNGMRINTANTQFFKNRSSYPRFWLNLTTDGGLFQEILIGYPADARVGYDRLYDAVKYKANPQLSFHSQADSLDLAIQGRPLLATDTIPLGIETNQSGLFTISLDSLDAWPGQKELYLEDRQEGLVIDLRLNDYTFRVDNPIGLEDRFFIRTVASGLELNESAQTKLSFYQKGEQLLWNESKAFLTEIRIYDLNGQLLFTQKATQIDPGLRLVLEQGLYLLRFQNTEGQWASQKIFWQR